MLIQKSFWFNFLNNNKYANLQDILCMCCCYISVQLKFLNIYCNLFEWSQFFVCEFDAVCVYGVFSFIFDINKYSNYVSIEFWQQKRENENIVHRNSCKSLWILCIGRFVLYNISSIWLQFVDFTIHPIITLVYWNTYISI